MQVLNTGGTVNAFDTPDNLIKAGGYFAKQLEAETKAL